MEKTLICEKHKPEAVIEKDDVHYFYWRVELGLGRINIGRLKIPTFPIKFLDDEPVKSITYGDKLVVLSRFHYRILVYFNNPTLNTGKPIVDFSFGSHSPFVHTDLTNQTNFGCNHRFVGADTRELDAFIQLVAFFEAIMKGKLKVRACRTATYDLTNSEIPNELLFKPSELVSIIWIGKLPDSSELTTIGYQ